MVYSFSSGGYAIGGAMGAGVSYGYIWNANINNVPGTSFGIGFTDTFIMKTGAGISISPHEYKNEYDESSERVGELGITEAAFGISVDDPTRSAGGGAGIYWDRVKTETIWQGNLFSLIDNKENKENTLQNITNSKVKDFIKANSLSYDLEDKFKASLAGIIKESSYLIKNVVVIEAKKCKQMPTSSQDEVCPKEGGNE
jgi:hypothetical protein